MSKTQEQLKPLLSEAQLEQAVARIATEISRDYGDKSPILVAILKGSFIFLADLVRRLNIPAEIEFVRLSSYGAGTVSSGKVAMVQGLNRSVAGRHVVVEDIVDTGLTVALFLDHIRQSGPASLKLCSLLDKPSRRKTQVTIDYLGFSVPDRFVVGYGTDCGEKFRCLPCICSLETIASNVH